MEAIGYSFLIEKFSLDVLAPYKKAFLTERSVRSRKITADGEEEFFPRQFQTDGSWQDHLLFAIRHEGVNLQVLKALFARIDVPLLEKWIDAKKHSVYRRRIWFLYEFLTGKKLNLEALSSGNYDDVLSSEQYFAVDREHAVRVRRQRLLNNLPGNAEFCPMVRLTEKIRAGIAKAWNVEISGVLKKYSLEQIYRASSFLYLKETKASYAIEHQTPSQKRSAAFMAVLQQAGQGEISRDFLIRLQNSVVEERYREKDFREDQVYVGQTLAPYQELVHFAGARPEDVPALMAAWMESAERMMSADCHPVIAAAVLSFAFVFIHPFDDGNGRIHRYLLHHFLARKKFHPGNIIFPVSAVLYKNAGLYDVMLESFSKKLMPHVDYTMDSSGRMTVQNETADYYRYADFTRIAEEFFAVIEKTIYYELVPELDYLIAWERMRSQMREVVDMPENRASRFILFVQQNHGVFPKRRRREFPELSDEEIQRMAEIVHSLCPNEASKAFA